MNTALITGANQGIGYETARQLEALGYFVYVGSRDAVKGQAAIDKLKQSGTNNIALLEIDIANPLSVSQAKKRLEAQIDVLDVLVNNAAIQGNTTQKIHEVEMKKLKNVFDTNFFGTVQTTQQLIPLLSKSSVPVIVNVSSELGSLHSHLVSNKPNFLLYDIYSASKTALNAFTVLLAEQLKGTPFKINSVTPGYTSTNLNNYQGAKTPAEGATVIVKYATLDSEGPTGGFFGHDGSISW